MYAVVETGGKQYRVAEGQLLDVELLHHEEATVDLSQVLLVEQNGQVQVGSPYLAGARVHCEVVGYSHGPKLTVYKYKKRKNQRRKKGHRQHYQRLLVKQIVVG